MKELIDTKNIFNSSRENRNEIFALGSQVEERIIVLAGKETDNEIRLWQDMINRPCRLLLQRDSLRALADEAPTKNIRQAFRACINRCQMALDQGSEDKAKSMLSCVEGSLARAEKLLSESASNQNLWRIDAEITSAKEHMEDIEKIPHVWHVGLPRLAEKRGISVDALCDDINRRINAAWITFVSLEDQRDKRRKLQRKEAVQAERDSEAQVIPRTISSMTKRSKLAGQAAQHFLEHAKLGNVGAATACFHDIRRYDGGVPECLQEIYKKLLQTIDARQLI